LSGALKRGVFGSAPLGTGVLVLLLGLQSGGAQAVQGKRMKDQSGEAEGNKVKYSVKQSVRSTESPKEAWDGTNKLVQSLSFHLLEILDPRMERRKVHQLHDIYAGIPSCHQLMPSKRKKKKKVH
jgi:hypothetical protein